MFILLKSGAMLNMYWLQDCFQGKHDKNIVIFYMVNGSKITEEYDTESAAANRVSEIHSKMNSVSTNNSSNNSSSSSVVTANIEWKEY